MYELVLDIFCFEESYRRLVYLGCPTIAYNIDNYDSIRRICYRNYTRNLLRYIVMELLV
jgi:hypothetical protein